MVEILRATDPNLIPCPTAEPPAHLVVETDTKRSGAKNKLSPLSLDPAFPRKLEVKGATKNSKQNKNRQSFIKQAQKSQKAKNKNSAQKENQNAIATVSIEMEDMTQKGTKTEKKKEKPPRKKQQTKTQNERELVKADKTVVVVHELDGIIATNYKQKDTDTNDTDLKTGQVPLTSGHLNKAFQTDDQTENADSQTGSLTDSQTDDHDTADDHATSVKV